MVELVAAVALAPWAQPLRFRPLSGWRRGVSGTVDSSYSPVPKIDSPRSPRPGSREASAIAIGRSPILLPRLSLAPTAGRRCIRGHLRIGAAQGETDPVAPQSRETLPVLRRHVRRRRRVRVSGRGTGSRILGDCACLLRLASNAPMRAQAQRALEQSNCPCLGKHERGDARLASVRERRLTT